MFVACMGGVLIWKCVLNTPSGQSGVEDTRNPLFDMMLLIT